MEEFHNKKPAMSADVIFLYGPPFVVNRYHFEIYLSTVVDSCNNVQLFSLSVEWLRATPNRCHSRLTCSMVSGNIAHDWSFMYLLDYKFELIICTWIFKIHRPHLLCHNHWTRLCWCSVAFHFYQSKQIISQLRSNQNY